jgi:polyisoprenoid-binding protein YceI
VQDQAAGFTARTTIRRSEFGGAAYLPVAGDEPGVGIEIEVLVPKG